MSRIVFIEPKSPNLHIYSQFILPRLGCMILSTLMKNRGWDVDLIIEQKTPVDFEKIRGADLVGISTITSTAPRAYDIADKIRSMGIPVIMGGPHVTFIPEEALNHCDYVIRGEGEKALMAFIDAWESSKDFSTVPNLSYRTADRIAHIPTAPALRNLDELPFPDFSNALDKPRLFVPRTIPVQTSRGCPFDCTFCSVTGMFGRRYRYRSTENIIAELRRYNSRKNYIFFYDDNFTADRKRAKALLQAMISEKFRFKWSTQVRADIAGDKDLVRLMKKAGCHTLYVGLESVNPESLKNMKKKQTVAEIQKAVDLLRRHRIHVHGMFVFGFDEDNWETVKKTLRFARKSRLTSSQFLILTPLPGSQFFDRITSEKRVLFHDWALYDAHHVVYKPALFTLLGLQKAQIFSHARFYSFRDTIKHLFRFQWVAVGVAHYARKLNRSWKKKNITFLKAIDLLSPRKDILISLDYQQTNHLDN